MKKRARDDVGKFSQTLWTPKWGRAERANMQARCSDGFWIKQLITIFEYCFVWSYTVINYYDFGGVLAVRYVNRARAPNEPVLPTSHLNNNRTPERWGCTATYRSRYREVSWSIVIMIYGKLYIYLDFSVGLIWRPRFENRGGGGGSSGAASAWLAAPTAPRHFGFLYQHRV